MPSTQKDLVVGDAKRALHEAAQFLRHRLLDFEPDHRAAAAALEHGLEQAHEIFGLFLDFDFGIADDAECALPLDDVAGEQLPDEQAGRLFERDQRVAALSPPRPGSTHEALDLAAARE